VIAGMSDIYGYAHQVRKDEMSVLTLRCSDGSIECGCRFKYIPDEIPMSYTNLVNAIQTAIAEEAKETNNQFVTSEKVVSPTTPNYDFDGLMKRFQDLCGDLMTANQSNANKIVAITDKYLGKGRKVSDCTEEQSEQIDLIVQDLQALLNN
jgi:hypothetical protein